MQFRMFFSTIYFVSSIVLAQTPASFVGEWKVTWQGEKRPLEAKLVITDVGGTWKTLATNRSDYCVGREVPIGIEVASENELNITLKFSEVLSGCSNALVRLHRSGANTISGVRGKLELTLTKDE
jgi:hypothetical protein